MIAEKKTQEEVWMSRNTGQDLINVWTDEPKAEAHPDLTAWRGESFVCSLWPEELEVKYGLTLPEGDCFHVRTTFTTVSEVLKRKR